MKTSPVALTAANRRALSSSSSSSPSTPGRYRKHTTESGCGARISQSGRARTHDANSWASTTCARRRSRMPSAPRPRNTNHSLRARKRRPSWQTVIHIVAHVAVGRRQVLRNEREGAPHHRLVAHVQHRAVHRHEHPFVRIDDQRIGTRDAVHEPPNSGTIAAMPAYAASTCNHTACARQIPRSARPGRRRGRVVPTVATTASGRMRRRRRARRHARGRRGSCDAPHRTRREPRLLVDAERDRRLFNVRVRVLGDVDAQDRQSSRPSCPSREYPDRATPAAASAVNPAMDAVS